MFIFVFLFLYIFLRTVHSIAYLVDGSAKSDEFFSKLCRSDFRINKFGEGPRTSFSQINSFATVLA